MQNSLLWLLECSELLPGSYIVVKIFWIILSAFWLPGSCYVVAKVLWVILSVLCGY